MNKKPLILIDSSALKSMIEGKETEEKLVKKIKELKDANKPIRIVTPMASLLRAIWLSNPEIKIQNLQKIIGFLDVGYSSADFKNENAVRDEILKIANIIGSMKKK